MVDLPDPVAQLPLRTSQDTSGEVRRVLAKLESAGRDFRIVRALANSTAAFRPYVLMSAALMVHSPVPARVREAVILRLSATRPTPYEWEEHLPLSEDAGVTVQQRDRIRSGDYADFDRSTRLALELADALMARELMTPARWRDLEDAWGPEATLDLILIVGWWGGFVPLALDGLGLRSPD